MRPFVMAVATTVATAFLVGTALASPHDSRVGQDVGTDGNGQAECRLRCVDEFQTCMQQALGARHACMNACAPLRAAVADACSDNQHSAACRDAIRALGSCTDACQTAFRSAQQSCR